MVGGDALRAHVMIDLMYFNYCKIRFQMNKFMFEISYWLVCTQWLLGLINMDGNKSNHQDNFNFQLSVVHCLQIECYQINDPH